MIAGLAARVLAGDARALARAATLIENRHEAAPALMQKLFPHTGRALVIGITGPPGAGKSTLASALARQLRRDGKTVGILAVDPSSPYSGGAILGDRIRMQDQYADPGVFIRSIATRGWLGGLARAATDLTLLLDAAGREVVLVETVGVGQDEVEIARLADVTLVVLVPGTGDDVQALKAGVMEIADVFVINKSDLPGADKLAREVKASLTLARRPDSWTPPVVSAVAQDGSGMAAILDAARAFYSTGASRVRSREVWAARLREMLREALMDGFPPEQFLSAAAEVAERRADPYSIIQSWLGSLPSSRLSSHES